MLGSVTEKVLRRAGVPVLTIPPAAADPPNLPFATVLCGLDRSDASARALEYSAMFARGSRARLVLAHVVENFLNEDPQFACHFDTEPWFRAAEPAMRAWDAARVPPEAHPRVRWRWCYASERPAVSYWPSPANGMRNSSPWAPPARRRFLGLPHTPSCVRQMCRCSSCHRQACRSREEPR